MHPLISKFLTSHRIGVVFGTVFLLSMASFVYADGLEFQISNIDDIDMGTWDSVSDMNGNDSVCVYKNDPADDTYQVTATDDSSLNAGEFRLENFERTAEIPYELNWSNASAPGSLLLRDGVALAASGANAASTSCEGGTNANVSIQIRAQDLMAAPAGTYKVKVNLQVGS